MSVLRHELWQEPGGKGNLVCLAGRMGRGARKLLEPEAEIVWTFEAGSHFEAMSKYYAHVGRTTYTTDQELDHQPYPEEWYEIQERTQRE